MAATNTPKFTRQHFEFLAAEVAKSVTEANDLEEDGRALTPEDTLGILARNLGQAFRQDNPRFDFVRFMDACGV
jgi:hypothetical protein